MQYLRTHTLSIIGFLLCLGAAWGLYYYFFTGSGNTNTTIVAAPTQSSVSGADVLTALVNLQAVKLDNAIFSNPVFVSLTDFGVDIPTQPVGRVNPFAPLPSAGAANGAASLPSNIKSGTATTKK